MRCTPIKIVKILWGRIKDDVNIKGLLCLVLSILRFNATVAIRRWGKNVKQSDTDIGEVNIFYEKFNIMPKYKLQFRSISGRVVLIDNETFFHRL